MGILLFILFIFVSVMIIAAPLIIASFTKLFPLYVFPFKETKRSPFFMSLEFKHIFCKDRK